MNTQKELDFILNEFCLPVRNFKKYCKDCACINHTALTEKLELDGINEFFSISQFISSDRTVDDSFRNLIRTFKDKKDYHAGFSLGRLLASAILSEREHWCSADGVIPVPPEPTRLLERGFSPASILATNIAANLEIPLFDNILTRTPCTARAINISSKKVMTTFSSDWYRADLEGKTVILVDDVLTTGQTLRTCATILKSFGVKKVFATTLAVSGYNKEVESIVPEILVISGPSGGGKTTIISEIIKLKKNIEHPVHYTTREPRYGEKDGIDFHFVDKPFFKKMVLENKMIAWTSFGQNFYGYSTNSVIEILLNKKKVVLNLEPFLALSLKLRWPSIFLVFLQPPNLEILIERLKNREPEKSEIWLEERIVKARESMNYRSFFDLVVTTQDISQTVSQLNNALFL